MLTPNTHLNKMSVEIYGECVNRSQTDDGIAAARNAAKREKSMRHAQARRQTG
jgi:hypothetical protein